MISAEYRDLNKRMHAEKPQYGTNGRAYADAVLQAMRTMHCESLLDYGCGKGTLRAACPPFMDVREYDPAIEGKDAPPEPADMVSCTDVLEHIEPEHIEDVLDHIKSLAIKAVFFVIHTDLANKHLPDGRNAHLIVGDMKFWLPKLWERWTINAAMRSIKGLMVIGECQPR